MARENFVLKTLLEKREVIFKPHGNSMTPKIYSGDKVKVISADSWSYRLGDIVYAKVNGNYYLHLLTGIDASVDKFQISNNHGHVNGWTNMKNVFGICAEINDKVILTKKDILGRFWNKDGKQWKMEDFDTGGLPLAVPSNFKITPELQKHLDQKNIEHANRVKLPIVYLNDEAALNVESDKVDLGEENSVLDSANKTS